MSNYLKNHKKTILTTSILFTLFFLLVISIYFWLGPKFVSGTTFISFLEKKIQKKTDLKIDIESIKWQPYKSHLKINISLVQFSLPEKTQTPSSPQFPLKHLSWVPFFLKHLDVSLANLTIEKKDGSFLLDKVATHFTLHLKRGKKNEIETHLEGEFGNFELVWNELYANFKNKKIQTLLKASINPISKKIQIEESNLTYETTKLAELSGDMGYLNNAFSINVQLHSSIEDLQKTQKIVSDTFGETYEFLKTFYLQGKSTLLIQASGQKDHLTFKGNINLENIDIAMPAKDMILKNLNFNFPFQFSEDALREPANTRRPGFFSIGEVKRKKTQIKKQKINFFTKDNGIFLTNPHEFHFLNGKMELHHLTAQAFPKGDRKLALATSAKNISYEKIGELLSIPAWPGKINWALRSVELKSNILKILGTIEMHAWQGVIKVKNISIEEPFSLVPIVHIKNIDIDHIRLLEGSEAVGLGVIDGIGNGFIHDLSLVEKVPVSFKMSFNTVPTSGVSQTISVEALKNISKLGGNGAGSAYDNFIYNFIKKFSYSQLGFEAELQDDLLQIVPKYRSGDTFYLMKGSFFPPSVDVVYKNNTDAKLPLPELIERLKNIDWKRKVIE